jgi:methionyl-tRNA synthetase
MVIWVRYEGGQEIYNVACPGCKELLNNEIDDKTINLEFTTEHGKGKLTLSQIWGDYSHTMEGVSIADREVVVMSCPHCNQSLLSEDICEDCGATTTMFKVSEGHIRICNRKGCKMHLKFLLTGE